MQGLQVGKFRSLTRVDPWSVIQVTLANLGDVIPVTPMPCGASSAPGASPRSSLIRSFMLVPTARWSTAAHRTRPRWHVLKTERVLATGQLGRRRFQRGQVDALLTQIHTIVHSWAYSTGVVPEPPARASLRRPVPGACPGHNALWRGPFPKITQSHPV